MPESRVSDWVELIRALFAGLKDLAVVGVSCFSLYLQAHVSNQQDTLASKVETAVVNQAEIEKKVDKAAVKAEEVKTRLEAAVPMHPSKDSQ